jgi:hypothetical protein
MLGVLLACGDTSTAAPDPTTCSTACMGATGDAGPPGPTGPQGPPGLITKSHLYMVSGPDAQLPNRDTDPANSPFSANVTCLHADDSFIAGGFTAAAIDFPVWSPRCAATQCIPTHLNDVTSGFHCDGVANGIAGSSGCTGHAWIVCSTP